MGREQATPGMEVTTVSDVYGLGSVLYADLTAAALFASQPRELLRAGPQPRICLLSRPAPPQQED